MYFRALRVRISRKSAMAKGFPRLVYRIVIIDDVRKLASERGSQYFRCPREEYPWKYPFSSGKSKKELQECR